MKKMIFCLIYTAVLLKVFPIEASLLWLTGGNQLFIGPEIYHVKRIKEGGAEQSGYLSGVRMGYERLKRYKVYWGLDALYAVGTLNGKLEGGHLRSELMDANLEERLGYTFEAKCSCQPSFTPFIGIGYFWEKNRYKAPSPIHIHFFNQFSYIPIGFLASIYLSDHFRVGFNFKARIILESRHEVSHDPEFDKVIQHYEEKTQYRIEVPLTYDICWCEKHVGMGLVPFYEYRHYGFCANFPFDFLETKFKLYGATLKFLYFF